MRFAGIISAFILSAVLGGNTHAQANESRVCKTVRHCVDLVERHAPDSFDYQVLNGEFQRFGQKGKAALINMLASKDETDIRRAQAVLAKGQTLLTPDEQRRVAALWPRGDLDTHAKVMQSALSPLMRARAIETLSHENIKVRKLSRNIIDATVARKMNFALRPEDYGRLAKALLDDPTPALVELTSTFEADKTKPVFMRLLQSTDGPTLSAAYQKLYEQNQEEAFKALVATLYGLKDNQAETAFAISYMLQERHKTREDGFYLKFAKDIAEDSEMSQAGRLAGFHAIMNNWGGLKNVPTLDNSPLMIQNLEYALSKQSVFPRFYAGSFYETAKDDPDAWLSLIWSKLSKDPYKNPYTADEFFDAIGKIRTPLSRKIVTQALSNKRDFGLVNLGIAAAIRQGDKSHTPQISALQSHPVTDVRAYAEHAIKALESSKRKVDYRAITSKIETLNSTAKMCRAEPKDFKADVKRLPFFDLKNVHIFLGGPLRNYIQTIAPTKTGWLVGYAAGEWGGDFQYYDNLTGKGHSLLFTKSPDETLNDVTSDYGVTHRNVMAIVPTIPQPLGQYANEFWAFIKKSGHSNETAIYKITGTSDSFNIIRHAQIPSSYYVQVAPQTNGDIFVSFYNENNTKKVVHPPLLLSPNGALRRACDSPQANQKTSSKAYP